MATIHLFGDEFGTMPVRDTDGVFLAAIVATRTPPARCAWEGRRAWFLEKLSTFAMVPQVVYVKEL